MQWIERTKKNHQFLQIDHEMEINLKDGGQCLIFDLLDELKTAFKDDKEIAERLQVNLKPNILMQKCDNRPMVELKFLILKVKQKIARLGKDPHWIFEKIDVDNGGTLDAEEIMDGFKQILGVIFSRDDAYNLTNYLDADKSGDVDYQEFISKMNLNNLHKDSHQYLISENNFIDCVLIEWYRSKKEETKKIKELINTYDVNKDGVMQLDEFQELLKELEPGLSPQIVLKLFKNATS